MQVPYTLPWHQMIFLTSQIISNWIVCLTVFQDNTIEISELHGVGPVKRKACPWHGIMCLKCSVAIVDFRHMYTFSPIRQICWKWPMHEKYIFIKMLTPINISILKLWIKHYPYKNLDIEYILHKLFVCKLQCFLTVFNSVWSAPSKCIHV